ncbi:MAG TPA: tetratricopeptide repeat protein [Bryobacteraceae bacterium]|nr:tetratricopeptide repeat protein [Bryobacteraceae bacterium]
MEFDSSQSLHRQALEALEAGRLEESVNLLRATVQESPSDSQAWNDLGVVMEALGNPCQAAHCYAQALRSQPFHREARANLFAMEMQTLARRRLREQAAQIVMSRIAPAGPLPRAARANSL